MSNLWIPTEKELPEAHKSVLVTVDYEYRWVSLAKINKRGIWYYSDTGEPIGLDFKIIAWLEVPKPYRGDIK